MKVLVTSFGAFGGIDTNPTIAVAAWLKQNGIAEDIDVVTEHLEVAYDQVSSNVPLLWKSHQPDVRYIAVFDLQTNRRTLSYSWRKLHYSPLQ